MKKIAAFIASGTGMGADAAKHLSSKGYDIAIMSSSGKGEKLANDLGGVGYTGSNLISRDIKAFINIVFSIKRSSSIRMCISYTKLIFYF